MRSRRFSAAGAAALAVLALTCLLFVSSAQAYTGGISSLAGTSAIAELPGGKVAKAKPGNGKAHVRQTRGGQARFALAQPR